MSFLGGERIDGIDAPLPPGERVRWQGRPALGPLARRAFHVRAILLYFGALGALRAVFAVQDGRPGPEVAAGVTALLLLGLVAAGIAWFLAWLSVRTTIYAITDRRVVLRCGIVLSGTVSIPFRTIERVDVRRFADGTGDVAIALGGNDRIAYLTLWPYARAWRLQHPEPLLRAVTDFDEVTAILREALAVFGTPAAMPPAPTTATRGGGVRREPMVAAAP